MFTSFPFAFWRGSGNGSAGFGLNYGYQFDGVDESLNFGNVLDLDGSSAFSFSFWIRRDTSSPEAFISKTNFSFDGFMIYSNGGGSFDSFLFYIGQNGSNTIQVQTNFPQIPANKWMHCVVTYDGSKSSGGVNIYINNNLRTLTVLRDTFTGSSSVSSDFKFGGLSSTYFYEGRLDDIQFYNFELNSTQVSDIYNSGYVTAPTASPIHHWKLGEEDTFSTNWTVKDSVGSLDGTSVNMEEVDRKLGVAYSMNFDGIDESVNFGNINDWDGSSPLTISFWFKYSAFALDYLLGKWGSGAGWLVTSFNSNIRFYKKDGSGNQTIIGGNTMTANNWYHVVITTGGANDGSDTLVYLNDVSTSFTYASAFSGSASNSVDFVVGTDSLGNNYTSGDLMYLSLFNTELSASDVTSLYNSGLPVDPRDVSLNPSFFTPLGGPNDTFSTNWAIVDEINGNNGTSVNMEEADKTSETP